MEEFVNVYETLVLSEIQQKLKGRKEANDKNYIADVACVALNRLPAHYVRHLVDMCFFKPEEETVKNIIAVTNAVKYAIDFIDSRQGLRPNGLASQNTI